MSTPLRNIRVAAAVLRRRDRILVARRPPGDALAGRWEFPGGKIETDETPEDCLRRELREELDLDCVIGPHLITVQHRYPTIAVELIVHDVDAPPDTPSIVHSTAHSEVRWLTASELASLDFAAADVPVVDLLQRQRSAPARRR